MLKIGLTGGIASGKTAVSDHFARLGVPIIDTDQISRELVEPGKPALAEIQKQLGAQFISEDGSLNRKLLRTHIFSNNAVRKTLESILHPAIRQEVEHRLSELRNEPYAIVVVPLLTENGLTTMVDRILLVDIPETLQVRRVCDRDNISKQQAEMILAAQASRAERKDIADDIIENSGDLQALRQKIEKLHKHYLTLSSRTV
jgi:dephospho-CoA kinase